MSGRPHPSPQRAMGRAHSRPGKILSRGKSKTKFLRFSNSLTSHPFQPRIVSPDFAEYFCTKSTMKKVSKNRRRPQTSARIPSSRSRIVENKSKNRASAATYSLCSRERPGHKSFHGSRCSSTQPTLKTKCSLCSCANENRSPTRNSRRLQVSSQREQAVEPALSSTAGTPQSAQSPDLSANRQTEASSALHSESGS